MIEVAGRYLEHPRAARHSGFFMMIFYDDHEFWIDHDHQVQENYDPDDAGHHDEHIEDEDEHSHVDQDIFDPRYEVDYCHLSLDHDVPSQDEDDHDHADKNVHHRYEEDYSDLGRDPDLNDMRINPSTYSLHSLRRFNIIVIIIIYYNHHHYCNHNHNHYQIIIVIMMINQERAKPDHNPRSARLAKKCHSWTTVFKVIMIMLLLLLLL